MLPESRKQAISQIKEALKAKKSGKSFKPYDDGLGKRVSRMSANHLPKIHLIDYWSK